MNEPVLDDHDYAPPPVKTSHWRVAVAIATLLGAGSYGFGRWAGSHDNGEINSLVVILTTSLGPLLALLGFTGFWVVLGDGRFFRRVLAVLGCIVGIIAVTLLAHSSIRPFLVMFGVPLAAAVTGVVLILVRSYSSRRIFGGAIALIAIAPWDLMRMNGVDGQYVPDFEFRWTPSAGELADAQLGGRATSLPTASNALTVNSEISSEDWPGFRGSRRTGEVPTAALHAWNGSQPRKIWEHKVVGPAWSSFCIVGNAVYTQEQRGPSESVVCYRADTGEEIWARGEESKHEDQPSGAGPRATPTYANGMIYATNATGGVSCLKAATGEPVWTVSMPERFEATRPMYGFSTSPLVVGDLVIINPSSAASPRLVALEAATGKTRWATEPKGTDGYSSPHPARIQDVDQVVIFNGMGLFGHDPVTGRELWHYDWKVTQMQPTAVQPLVLPDGRIVIGGGNIGLGIRCVKVSKEGENWKAEELWKSVELTPKFNDVVRRGEYLYGLHDSRLRCIKLADGKAQWKGDKSYGQGQILLTGENLLVLSEKGKIACVEAKPDDCEELWEIAGVNGKTWNHPAIAHGRLFIRSMGEMAAFDLGAEKK